MLQIFAPDFSGERLGRLQGLFLGGQGENLLVQMRRELSRKRRGSIEWLVDRDLLAGCLVLLGRYEEALDIIRAQIARYKDSDDSARIHRCYYLMGEAVRRSGGHGGHRDRLEDALNYLSLAASYDTPAEDRRQRILTLRSLGATHFYLHHFEAALQIFRTVLELARELQDRYLEMLAVEWIGMVHQQQPEHLRTSVAMLRRSLRASYTDEQFLSQRPYTLLNLARSFVYLGQYPAADECQRRADAMAPRKPLPGLKYGLRFIRELLGVASWVHREKWHEALKQIYMYKARWKADCRPFIGDMRYYSRVIKKAHAVLDSERTARIRQNHLFFYFVGPKRG